ncbi:MAG: hypothetical protein NDJ89_04100 [Oligoflexia bacterium]|nr:hypothetical protein [Oligoflexia bacterium]
MSNGSILYPSVTSLPGQSGVGQSERLPRKQEGVKGEFDQVFERTLGNAAGPDLSQVKAPLKFSAHATQRLNDRRINLDPATMARVSEAIDKAEAKGIEDTLVLTDKAALIVSVKNRTVITAMDKGSLAGNVFTNIDGAVIV